MVEMRTFGAQCCPDECNMHVKASLRLPSVVGETRLLAPCTCYDIDNEIVIAANRSPDSICAESASPGGVRSC